MSICFENDALIYEMCNRGCSNKEIADAIGASVEAVKTYCKHLKYHIDYRNKRDKTILVLLKDGLPIKDISESQCVSTDLVKSIAKRNKISILDYGIDKEHVIALIEERKTYDEIASEIGCTTTKLKGFCKRHGLRTETKCLPFDKKKQIITDVKNGMSVNDTALKYSVSIPVVYKCIGHIADVKSPHKCPACGRLTKRPLWCSDECLRKETVKRGHATRRARIVGAMIDRDITLDKLIKRDNGVCHICGKLVDTDDFTIKNGAFIAGNLYPSIDHNKPLAKGGKHSWANVMLAHRICNSIKGDDLYGVTGMEEENHKADERLRCV